MTFPFRAHARSAVAAVLAATLLALLPAAAHADLAFRQVQFDDVGGVDGLASAVDVAVSPDQRHVYAIGRGDRAVAGFARDAVDGTLTFLFSLEGGVTPGVELGFGLTQIVVSADGANVYVTGDSGSLASFARDAESGALSQQQYLKNDDAGGTVPGLGSPNRMAFGPGETHLYVASRRHTGNDDGGVVVLSRDPATGGLSPEDFLRDVDGALAVAVSPDGRHVYVSGGPFPGAQAVTASLAAYARAPDGALTLLDDVYTASEPGFEGMAGAAGVFVSPDGAHVYVLDNQSETVRVYERNADDTDPAFGTLTLASVFGESFPSAFVQRDARMLFSGDGLSVLLASDQMSTLRLDRDPSTGALTAPSALPVYDTGPGIALSADGAFLYAARRDAVFTAALDVATGNFEDVQAIEDGDDGVDGLGDGVDVVVSPDGRSVYVASRGDRSIAVLERNLETGVVRFVEEALLPPFASVVQGMAVSQDGRHLYAGVQPVYLRDAATGALTPGGGDYVAGNGKLALSPDGRHVYSYSLGATWINVQARDPATGALGPAARFDDADALRRPVDLVMSPDGAHVYVATNLGDAPTNEGVVTVLARDPLDGSLSRQQVLGDVCRLVPGVPSSPSRNTVRSLATSPDGANLYAGCDNLVSRIDRDADPDSPSFGALVHVEGTDGDGQLSRQAFDVAVSLDGGEVYASYIGTTFTSQKAVTVFTRDADPASPDFGRIVFASLAADGAGGVDGLLEPLALALSPDNRSLYVTAAEALVVFDRRDGAAIAPSLDPIQVLRDGEGGVSGLTGPLDLALSPDGNNAYVISSSFVASGSVDALAWFTRDGAYAAPGDPVPDYPDDGKLTFAGSIVPYVDDGTGNLEPGLDAGGSPVAGIDRPKAIAVSPGDGHLSGGEHLYVIADVADIFPQVGTLALFRRGAQGQPLYVAHATDGDAHPGGTVAGLGGARDVLVSPDGAHVYVARSGSVAVFARNAGTGSALFAGLVEEDAFDANGDVVDGLVGAKGLAITPDGQFLYVVSSAFSNDSNAVAVFRRDAATGALDWLEVFKSSTDRILGLSGVESAAVSADGTKLYLAGGFFEGTLTHFDIDPATGRLSAPSVLQNGVGNTAGLRFAAHVAVSPLATQPHVFVASAAPDNALAVFAERGDGPSATFVEALADGEAGPGGVAAALADARRVEPSPDGRFLYAIARGADALTVLAWDQDGDGTPDGQDAFPDDPAESLDTDRDGIGNNADPDDDGDGIPDDQDGAPLDATASADFDGDGFPDAIDSDDDNDFVLDLADAFPLDPTESRDFDGDGVGDNADPDDDNDGTPDEDDAFPFDPTETSDFDGDGVGDNADVCPLVADPGQEDFDGGGAGDACDPDDDNDGIPDVVDGAPYDDTVGGDLDGDGIDSLIDDDDDGDGIPDETEIDLGLDPFDASDAGDGDADLDRFNGRDELLAGSNPLDAASVPSAPYGQHDLTGAWQLYQLGDAPWWERCGLVFDAAGTLTEGVCTDSSGAADDLAAGGVTGTVTPAGRVDLGESAQPDVRLASRAMDLGRTVFAGIQLTDGDGGASERSLSVAVARGTGTVTADLAGTWHVFELGGDVAPDVDADFWQRSVRVVDATGTVQSETLYTDAAPTSPIALGALALTLDADGGVTSDAGIAAEHDVMDAGRTVIAGVATEALPSASAEDRLRVWLKQGDDYQQSDLAGVWQLYWMSDVAGGDAPRVEHLTLAMDAAGAMTVDGADGGGVFTPFGGVAVLDGDGRVVLSGDIAAGLTHQHLRLDAGRTVMAGVVDEDDAGVRRPGLLVAVKSAVAPPALVYPPPGRALDDTVASFQWSANGTASGGYRLYVGTAPGASDVYDSGVPVFGADARGATVPGLPNDGRTVHSRLWYLADGAWQFSDAEHTAFDAGGAVSAPGLVAPLAGAKLAGSTASFAWRTNATPVTGWRLWVGSTAGAFDVHDSGVLAGDVLAREVTGLPADGRDLHVRLWYRSGTWQFVERQVEAAGMRPALVSHANGETLLAASDTFQWAANGVGADGWALWFGSTPGGRQHGFALTGNGADTSLAFARLPYDGSTVHVTLWWRVNGRWDPLRSRRYTLTAFTAAMPALTGPDGDGGGIGPGEPLAGTAATFSWNDGGTPLEDTAVWFGSTPGGRQHGFAWASQVAPADPASVSELDFERLPYAGETVHVTFYWKVRGRWSSRAYTFTAATLGPPVLTGPDTDGGGIGTGEPLAGASATFTWDDRGVPATDHAIWFGSTPGGRQYGYAWARDVAPGDPASVTELTFDRLPYAGETVHVTFYWFVHGKWHGERYTYTAANLPDPALTSHGEGSVLAPSGNVFTWDDMDVPVEDVALWFGSTPGGRQYGYAWARDDNPADPAAVDTLTFDGLPADGRTVHVTFWWQVGGRWFSRRYPMTTADGSTACAAAGCGDEIDAACAALPTLAERMVCAHNVVRANVAPAAATPLPDMTWDAQLAQVAADHAAQCVFAHSDDADTRYAALGGSGPVGENLAAGTSHSDLDLLVLWAEEAQHYGMEPIGTPNPEPVGHYTQMVWAGTERVGCAVADCSADLAGASFGGDYLVCNYAPAGNFIGQIPYTPAAP